MNLDSLGLHHGDEEVMTAIGQHFNCGRDSSATACL